MSKTYELTISKLQSGERLDKIFSAHFKELSRSFLQKNGKFKIDDQEKGYKTKAKEGEHWILEVENSFDAKLLLEPWDHSLEILAETDQWVALNKSEGVSVHPSPSEQSNHTIVNALLHHHGKKGLSNSFEEVDGVKIPRLGIVHRLDKPTSGVLLVAKDNPTHTFLQDHWGEVEKIYYALVEGHPPPKGHIEGAIIRNPHDKLRMTVSRSSKAKEAQTSFEVVESGETQSLLRVQIHTGRTHQIRVHLSSIGFPIIGDEIYGKSKAKRMMLHAANLKFPDPKNPTKMVEITAPLPKNFILT